MNSISRIKQFLQGPELPMVTIAIGLILTKIFYAAFPVHSTTQNWGLAISFNVVFISLGRLQSLLFTHISSERSRGQEVSSEERSNVRIINMLYILTVLGFNFGYVTNCYKAEELHDLSSTAVLVAAISWLVAGINHTSKDINNKAIALGNFILRSFFTVLMITVAGKNLLSTYHFEIPVCTVMLSLVGLLAISHYLDQYREKLAELDAQSPIINKP